jgi:peptide deformylase
MSSLQLIHYPHPTLRHKSKPIARVNAELKGLVEEMFDIMYEFRGVGLAANQVDLPIRLFIANPSGEKEEGPELVFINPVIVKANGTVVSEEGCLSLPGLNAPVKRNKTLQINAFGLDGTEINANIDGFLARIIQHEIDHLDGVLFIDRLAEEVRRPLGPDIEKFEVAFAKNIEMGRIPSAQDQQFRLAGWESKFC